MYLEIVLSALLWLIFDESKLYKTPVFFKIVYKYKVKAPEPEPISRTLLEL